MSNLNVTPYRLYAAARPDSQAVQSSVNLAHSRERSATSRRVSSSLRVSLISRTRLRAMVGRRRWYSHRPISCRDSLATLESRGPWLAGRLLLFSIVGFANPFGCSVVRRETRYQTLLKRQTCTPEI